MLNNPVIQAILQRRSHRAYQPRQISDDELEVILTCARYAPSASNSQSWHFTVVQDQALLDEFAMDFFDESKRYFKGKRAFKEGYHVFFHAPTVIFISSTKENDANCAYAAENICIAAQSLGIGSVILGYPNMVFRTEKGPQYLYALGLPDGQYPYICVALGYPASEPVAPPRKENNINFIRGD